jgi:hypothetical protein
MNNFRFGLVALAIAIVVVGILWIDRQNSNLPQPAPPQAVTEADPISLTDLQIVTGQLVFVPAYSEIAWVNATTTIDLTATLAIHNTDPDTPIIIKSVRYYDTNGNLVRDFVTSPVSLQPLATTGFVVAAGEAGSGWGTNFLVEWGAESAVYEPVIEAVMVSRQGNEGISFISVGRVVSETGK